MKSACVVILVLMASVYASPIQRRELEEMTSMSKLQLVEENAFFYIILTFEDFQPSLSLRLSIGSKIYAINSTPIFFLRFCPLSIISLTAYTTVKPDYNAILHQLGEYFKGRDLKTRQLAPVAGDSTVARDDILHELGEYWKGRIAALSALLSQHNIQQHIHVFSQLLNN